MIVYKRSDSTLTFGWDFAPELPAGVTLSDDATAQVFDDEGTDVTGDLLGDVVTDGLEMYVYVKSGGSPLKDYRIILDGKTSSDLVHPVHEVTLKVRDSG